MSAATVMRNQTRLNVFVEADEKPDREVERAIRRAVGDPDAKVYWYWTNDGEDGVIVVEQKHGTWWAHMPAAISELLGDRAARCVLTWRDDERPKADEE